MSLTWEPEVPASNPNTVHEWSDKAELVWQELLKRKQRATKQEPSESGTKGYYDSIYQQSFGTPLPGKGCFELSEVSEQEFESLTQINVANIKKETEDPPDDSCKNRLFSSNPSQEDYFGLYGFEPGHKATSETSPKQGTDLETRWTAASDKAFHMQENILGATVSQSKQQQKTFAVTRTELTFSQEQNVGSQPLFSQLTDKLHCSQERLLTEQGDQLIQPDVTFSPPLDLSPENESYMILSQRCITNKKLQTSTEDFDRDQLGKEKNTLMPSVSDALTSGSEFLPEQSNGSVQHNVTKPSSFGSEFVQKLKSSVQYNVSKPSSSTNELSEEKIGKVSLRSSLSKMATSRSAVSLKKPGVTLETETRLTENLAPEDSSVKNTQKDSTQKQNILTTKTEMQGVSHAATVHLRQGQLNTMGTSEKREIPLNNAQQEHFTISGRLHTLSTLLKQTDKKPVKRKVSDKPSAGRGSFNAPFKKKHDSSTENNVNRSPSKVNSGNMKQRGQTYQLKHVIDMSNEERRTIQRTLSQAEELAMTLMYQDGSSQLRENIEKKKSQPEFLLLQQWSGQKYDHMPSTMQGCATIRDLMLSKARKLCFEAQEMIHSLFTKIELQEKEVCTEWQVIDLKVAGWLLNPDNPPVTFKHVLMPYQDLKQEDMSSSEAAVCSDLSLLGPAMLHTYHRLKQQELWEIFTDIEMPLVPILAVMETRSILFKLVSTPAHRCEGSRPSFLRKQMNTSEMTETCQLLKKRLTQLEQEAHNLAGQPFNINSHPQLRQVLFEVLQLGVHLPKSKRSHTTHLGKQSTSEAVLTQLQDVHPLPKIVLEHRQLQKLKSTYVDGMMVYVNEQRLHTHWDQTAAATGRLTSTNPNIQAIPKLAIEVQALNTGIVGKKTTPTKIFARSPFISREGWSFLAADFRQIELRILAHLSNDETLLRLFNGQATGDIFTELASMWLCKNSGQVNSQEREQAKRVVYAVMYGAGKDRLAEYLKISTDDAKAIMQSFLLKFPGISSYTKSCVDKAKAQRFQTTVFKRRRFLPKITDCKQQLRAQAERQAINFSVQGSAADLCKSAMIRVEKCLQSAPNLQGRLLFQIHDELLLEVPDTEIQQTAEHVASIMEDVSGLCGDMCTLRVPLEVSLSVGKSWGHLSDYHRDNQ